jgi:hypothetical protein
MKHQFSDATRCWLMASIFMRSNQRSGQKYRNSCSCNTAVHYSPLFPLQRGNHKANAFYKKLFTLFVTYYCAWPTEIKHQMCHISQKNVYDANLFILSVSLTPSYSVMCPGLKKLLTDSCVHVQKLYILQGFTISLVIKEHMKITK